MTSTTSTRHIVTALLMVALLLPYGSQFSRPASFSRRDCQLRVVNNHVSSRLFAAASSETTSKTKHTNAKENYREPAYLVTAAELDFNISSGGSTRVTSNLTIVLNENSDEFIGGKDLILDGDRKFLSLLSLTLTDGRTLEEGIDYELSSDKLKIKAEILDFQPACNLQVVVDVCQRKNRELLGLFQLRDGMLCTHCEPQGMKRITYFIDRPDNLCSFLVRIEAEKDVYPILLSNGNLLDSGDTAKNDESSRLRHYAIFHDPYPKPCYLFGLVAAPANFGYIQSNFTTKSGRCVELFLYGEFHQLSKLDFAMNTLKKAMKWDEATYGLEYDLDVYRIVASQAFSIGAMENKGLNFFMTSLIATDPARTTDMTYDIVEKIISHEYFHNWSGNKVTIRDWLEFGLKEGLTVFRDQEFTSDTGLRTATRINAVNIIRDKQFREDASPVRPDNFSKHIQNLDDIATFTTYNKGAEIFRMCKTILSKSGFRKGFSLYTRRNDGRAATFEDFIQSMEDANDTNLYQFSLWYSTPGTPTVSYNYSFNAPKKRFELQLTQRNNYSGIQLHIPIVVGLLDKSTGKEVVPNRVLNLKEKSQTFYFEGLQGDVVPSMLRSFSAPVHFVPERGTLDEEAEKTMAFLATYDTDYFNRWDSMQKLFIVYILALMDQKEELEEIERMVGIAFGRILKDTQVDASSKSYFLTLPPEYAISKSLETVDPDSLCSARNQAKKKLARKFLNDIKTEYETLTTTLEKQRDVAITDTMSRARRSLRNTLLEYLCSIVDTLEEQEVAGRLASRHFEEAKCFTDQLIAFRQLASMSGAAADTRNEVMQKFYDLAKNDTAVMNKWFQTQALADLPDTLERVQALTQHHDFKATNVGRFRSLITSFTMNSRAFHSKNGNGYRFISDVIMQMDRIAPSLSVELATKLAQWRQCDAERSALMKAELHRLRSMKPMSQNLSSFLTKVLPANEFRTSLASPGPKKKKKQNKNKSNKANSRRGFPQ